MDKQTYTYYQDNAAEICKIYELCASPLNKCFPQVFHKCSKVLDVGCGSGRDMKALLDLGFDIYGCDASEEMIEQSILIHPEFDNKIDQQTLPKVKYPHNSFDGILCSAVLMHLTYEQVVEACENFYKIVNAEGILLVSIPEDSSISERDENGRLFNGLNHLDLSELLAEIGFNLKNHWINEDSIGRKKRKWHVLAFESRKGKDE